MGDLMSFLFNPASATPQQLREIENNYHIALIAGDTHEKMKYQAGMLRLQAHHAQTLQTGLAELSNAHFATNQLLGDIRIDLGSLRGDVFEVLCELTNLNSTVQSGLEAISQQLQGIGDTLDSIHHVLTHPYEAKAGEVREEAFRWLSIGASRTGRSRTDDWNDAMRLYDDVLTNPIGMQDYSAWFHKGYLHWKHENDVPGAKSAFERAVRLSSVQQDAYWVMSVRHLAEMLYLLGDYRSAYDILSEVTGQSRNHLVMYDQARYLARLGKSDEAICLLRRCIVENPLTYVAMQAEEDFLT